MTLILRAGTLVLVALLFLETTSSRAAAAFSTGFEPPTYVSGDLAGQDSWSGGIPRVQTQAELDTELTAAGLNPADSVHGGSQAVIVTGTGGGSTTIRPISGFETATRAVLDVWARPLTPGASESTVGTNLGNIFIVTESPAGTTGRAAAFRFGATVVEGVLQATSIDVLSAGSTWLPTGIAWQPDTWYNIRLDADYSTKTYDAFIDGAQVMNDVAFVHAASTHLSQLRVFRGSGQAGMIIDDLALFVPEPGASVLLFAAGCAMLFRRRR